MLAVRCLAVVFLYSIFSLVRLMAVSLGMMILGYHDAIHKLIMGVWEILPWRLWTKFIFLVPLLLLAAVPPGFLAYLSIIWITNPFLAPVVALYFLVMAIAGMNGISEGARDSGGLYDFVSPLVSRTRRN